MKKFLLSLALLTTGLTAVAQEQAFTPKTGAIIDGRTIVKTNLLGYAVGSYSISVERLLTKRLSVQLGYSKMNEREVNGIIKVNELIKGDFNPGTLASESKSIDLRLYLSRRGYGHGFYLQPYFRQETHNLSGVQIKDTSSSLGRITGSEYIPYSIGANIKSNSFGLALGAQWLIGKKKNILIDWTIIGAHYSDKATSSIIGTATGTVTELDRNDFKDEVTKIFNDAKLIEKGQMKFETSADGKQISTNNTHPYAFLRSSLSIGIRF